MYCEYFGFSEKPFDVTPDPNFLYLSPAHEEMLASILYGIQERPQLKTFNEISRGFYPALLALNLNTIIPFSFPWMLGRLIFSSAGSATGYVAIHYDICVCGLTSTSSFHFITSDKKKDLNKHLKLKFAGNISFIALV